MSLPSSTLNLLFQGVQQHAHAWGLSELPTLGPHPRPAESEPLPGEPSNASFHTAACAPQFEQRSNLCRYRLPLFFIVGRRNQRERGEGRNSVPSWAWITLAESHSGDTWGPAWVHLHPVSSSGCVASTRCFLYLVPQLPLGTPSCPLQTLTSDLSSSSIGCVHHAPGEPHCGQHHPVVVPARPAQRRHPGL